MMALLLALAAAFPPPSPQGTGQTFYLSPEGSDAGDGSLARPWRTLAHAASRIPDNGSTVLLLDGVYEGLQAIARHFRTPATFRAAHPYRAVLRNPSGHRVLRISDASNVILDGLELEGAPARGEYLVHLGTARAHHITVQNCILHDSHDNDIVKINDRASFITFRGNLFYNQNRKSGDEHLDINTVTDVTIEDNIFFNDFAGSGRENLNNTHPFILVKNSGREPVTRRIRIRRNIFLNWEGARDQPFLLLGEDAKPFHEAEEVTVENNLFLGNSPNPIGSAFGIKGARDILFRANTVSGDLPCGGGCYAFRINREGANPLNDRILFHNNIWSDPTGTMEDFADGPPGDSTNVVLRRNLYWNGGRPIPRDPAPANFTDDPAALVANPGLANPRGLVLPRRDPRTGRFLSGSASIREEFVRLATAYGAPPAGSPAIDAADPAESPPDDLLGLPRPAGTRPDLGALETRPEATRRRN